ncbi:MAG TPA: M12 family metallo-peptidase, partial [Polyangiaceae bacterium]|nr:M12 family metallo-peptidase [Polyangiaceae bacterium]
MTSRTTGTRALAFCGLMSLALAAACNTGSSGGENLPYPGVPSGGSGGSAGGAAGSDGGPVEQGCLKCACYPNGTCNAGMACISGTCTKDGCSSDSECAEGNKCESGACVPEGCGDGKVAGTEECDDGNTVNGDGCNRRCAKESSGDLVGGDPVGAEPGSENLPVADQEECESETKNTAYAPGDELTLSICMISYADSNGSGLNKLEMVDAISKAGQFYAAAGAKIKLDATTEHALTEIAAPAIYTDPGSQQEVESLMEKAWSRFETSIPGQCHVVVGFVNTMKNDSGSVGGIGSKPDAAHHVVLVPVNHPNRAYSIAHELGHALGLKHTHETASSSGDGCADTVKDPGCWETSSGCDATCSTGTPPAENVMSYYKCDVPSAESLTPCQVRRARCFATKLFPVNCPVPKLLTPTDATVVAVGQKDVPP